MSSRASGKAASRADSPAPKASAKREDKPQTEQKAPVKEEKEEDLILGLHPQAFYGIVVAPICVFMAFAIAAGPGRQYVLAFMDFVVKTWNQVRDPAEQILIGHGDLVIVGATMVTFAPLMYLSLVTLCRILNDLEHFTPVQKICFITLVLGAMAASIYTTKDLYWTPQSVFKRWEEFARPMEKVMTENVDNVIAGSALIAFSPLMYCLFMTVVRTIWGCRVKLVVEKDDAEESTQDN